MLYEVLHFTHLASCVYCHCCFFSAFLCAVKSNEWIDRYRLKFLGSVQVPYHKGNDVLCAAMQKVSSCFTRMCKLWETRHVGGKRSKRHGRERERRTETKYRHDWETYTENMSLS